VVEEGIELCRRPRVYDRDGDGGYAVGELMMLECLPVCSKA
jgi:hypothetical protein